MPKSTTSAFDVWHSSFVFARLRGAVGVLGVAIAGLLFDDQLDGVALVLVEQIVDRAGGAGAWAAVPAAPLREDRRDQHADNGEQDDRPHRFRREIGFQPP